MKILYPVLFLFVFATINAQAQLDTLKKDSIIIENMHPVGSEEFDFSPVFSKPRYNTLISSRRAPRPALEVVVLADDSSTFYLDSLPGICLINNTNDTSWLAMENRSFCCINLHLHFKGGGGFIIPYNYKPFISFSRKDVAVQILPGDSLFFTAATNDNYSWTDEHRVAWYEHKWFPTQRPDPDIWVMPILIDSTRDTSFTEKPLLATGEQDTLFFEADPRGEVCFIFSELLTSPKEEYPGTVIHGFLSSKEVVVFYDMYAPIKLEDK